MPRTYPPARTHTAVRLSPEGLAEVDAIAEAEDRSRSQVIRMLLKEALLYRAGHGQRVPGGVTLIGGGGPGGSGRSPEEIEAARKAKR